MRPTPQTAGGNRAAKEVRHTDRLYINAKEQYEPFRSEKPAAFSAKVEINAVPTPMD